MCSVLLNRYAALKVIIAFTQEVQLEFVALDGLIAALFTLEFLKSASLTDRVSLVVIPVTVIVGSGGRRAVVFVVVMVIVLLVTQL